ncbi:LPS export ABC transporter periplasmic protein LptC [Mizugakiibacter sediminis]|uniref:LPS export ABC transporter periplasmic protein LptC n=1 Tax=Mizugakiibacter sediminis TaxID=1475481 RepID=UPI0016511A56|nr:LPS export ABC transporter periplasmic protein LptC [Mizugakiibacter sediminis]
MAVIERRRTLVFAALLLAAAVSQLLVWWLRPPPRPSEMVGPPRSAYTLNDFTMNALDENGRLSLRVDAPYLARREGDDSLYINAPRFFMPGKDGADWHGASEYGWVSADGNLMKLLGKVDMQRTPTAQASAAEVHTSDLTAWLDENRVATDAPTLIRQPGSMTRGIGMRANLDTHEMELLSHVHSQFTPRRRAQDR